MKKISIVLIIMILAASAVFAGGNSEKRQAATGSGQGQGPVLQAAESGTTEEVTLSGTLVMKDGFLVLSVDDALYSLGGRGTRLYIDEFEAGDVIEVQGILVTDCRDDCDRDLDGHIFMEKVTRNGEEFTFEPPAGGSRGNGRGQRKGNSPRGTGYRWSEA